MTPYFYDAADKDTYRVMNQTGVRQCVMPSPTTHNASWDGLLGPEGEVYFSLCSELTTSEYARLAVYDPWENRITPLHYTKDFIFPNDRFIRDSKLHTSMAWMNDGRMIMLTHTTDKSPEHPAWMPLAYYHDPWTGYPGSSLLCYDPATGKMENWGIPVHRETLYGAAYDRIRNMYYAIGFLKGHLYGISLTDRSVRDYGQVTERASYRLVVGSDDNIYFTTRNGLLQRINVRTQEVEDLRIQLPYREVEGRFHAYLSYAVNGSDGRLYMAGMHDERLSCYDPATGKFTVLGNYMPAQQFASGVVTGNYLGCMGFDREDVLYYVVCAGRAGGEEDFCVPAMLMRWDLLRGGEPEILGFPGTPAHVTTRSCCMLMDPRRDQMYIIATNHANDGPHITAVDLSVYRGCAGEEGTVAEDPLLFPGNGCYEEHGATLLKGAAILRENPAAFSFGKAVPVCLWKAFDDVENSGVADLRWEGDELVVICGKDHYTQFVLGLDGEIRSRRECQAPVVEKPVCEAERLPCYPGRQYKRGAALAVPLAGGRRLVATEDGLLAVENGRKMFALGSARPNGPVNAMTVSADLRKVYGVAGDRDDIGVVFSYDDEEGLRCLGHVSGNDCIHGEFSAPYLTAIALHSGGKYLAVGAGGRMGSVYLYHKAEPDEVL